MKKIIGILGIVAIAMALFFSTNAINSSNGDLDLSNLLATNIANAEIVMGVVEECHYYNSEDCTTQGVTIDVCDEGSPLWWEEKCYASIEI